MQWEAGPGDPYGHPASTPGPAQDAGPRRRRSRRTRAVVTAGVLGAGLGVAAALLLAGPAGRGPDPAASPRPRPASTGPTPSPAAGRGPDFAAARLRGATTLLAQRAAAVRSRDRAGFLATVDPAATGFYAAQARLFDRLATLRLARWSYAVVGDGPGLGTERARQLPVGAAILRVRLSYRLAGTVTTTDREQYLTLAPGGGGPAGWRLVSDTDAAPNGLVTQRDLWDLGPIRTARGAGALVLADRRGTSQAQAQRLADEAAAAVREVDSVWPGRWSRRPVVLLPRSQRDMATLIGSDGKGLGQIAAVTTGAVQDGLRRGDRVVLNPGAWDTLGALGQRVVLTHEMTHVATRASTVRPPPTWLSEGFADYVAYRATPVPAAIVASDLLEQVRAGNSPRRLPGDAEFDATRGTVAAAYEGAWLACRLVARRYGEARLVALYAAVTDSSGPGWPGEARTVLGVGARTLVRQWRAALRVAAADG